MPGFDVSHVEFSPREPLLAMAGFRWSPTRVTKLMLWNFVTRQTVNEWTISSTGDSCTGLFFSEDGQMLVTSQASDSNEIGFWRVATGEALRRFPTAPTEGQPRYAFFAVSRDLKLAAYISRGDYHVHVLDLVTGRELWSKPAGAEGANVLRYSPDGKILAGGDRGQESPIRLWEARTGIELGRLEGNRLSVTQLVYWPDGKTLASSGADQTVCLWDVVSRRLKRTFRGHSTEVFCLALLPDDTTIVSGSKNGELLLWDTTTAEPAARAVTVIPGAFMGWRFADAGGSIITVEHDGRIAERRGENYREAKTLLQLGSTIWAADIEARVIVVEGGWPRSGTGSTILARDRSRLAHVSADWNIEVWDWERGGRVSVIAANDRDERLAPLSFADRGAKLLLSRFVPRAGVTREEWDVAAGRQTRTWKATADPPALTAVVVLSPDEKRFMSIASPTALVRTDLASGSETRLELDVRNAPQLGSFSADGSLFAAPTWNGLVQVVNVDPLRSVATLSGFFGGIYSAAFSPDGRRLATGSGSGEAMTLWEVGSYERLLTLKAAGSQVRQTAFSPDGNVLGALVGVPPKSSLHFWRAPSWAEIERVEAAARAAP